MATSASHPRLLIRRLGDIGEIHEHVDFDRFGTVVVKSRSAEVESEKFPMPMR